MMEIVKYNGIPVAVLDHSERLDSVQAALDAMATARYLGGEAMAIYKESFGEEFFDLKNRLAGQVLQKFSNYRVRLAIVGDFGGYDSKALRDFIYECNQGTLVNFKSSLEEALNALTSNT